MLPSGHIGLGSLLGPLALQQLLCHGNALRVLVLELGRKVLLAQAVGCEVAHHRCHDTCSRSHLVVNNDITTVLVTCLLQPHRGGPAMLPRVLLTGLLPHTKGHRDTCPVLQA